MQYVFYAMAGYGVTMVLRCSLLGHDYGETDVEREREERGSEVVVTVQEYQECTRCGERTVISENTEVTSLTTEADGDRRPDELQGERQQETEPDTDTGTDTDTDTDTDTEDVAVEFIHAEADENDLTDAATATPTDTVQPDDALDTGSDGDDSIVEDGADEIEVPTDENGDPVTDDGEILDSEDESESESKSESATPRSDRAHGEWPESDDVGPPVGADDEPETWPDDGNGDQSESEPAPVDDAIVLDAEDPDEDPIGVDASPPDPAEIETTAPSDDTDETDPGSGIKRARSAPAPTDARASPDAATATELYCPSCEYVAGSDRSSLRTGDICPECRKGYLSERTS